ncbi:malate/lactate/ureidoglycolate dehydrogenase [Tistrella bauzanensis]|uniref:malate/lactate/ureidoglycolate dehydrogenase n=1 Tax=Tistrella TaxID=171436 RepID=UPI0031F6E3E4
MRTIGRTIGDRQLRAAATALLEAAGSAPAEAAIVADHLVGANLAGHDSHGVGMIPRYVENVAAGLLHPNHAGDIVTDSGSLLVVDGGAGYGQVIMRDATDLAVARASETGAAILAVRNCHHMGRIGSYGEQVAAAGQVGLMFVNVTGARPLVAPHLGFDARFATNPICLSFPGPGGQPPVIFDAATSAVALGKCRVAMNKGDPMAAGLLIDPDGRPTTDPSVMFADPQGALLPAGGHKGYGLALFCELLAGALTGAGTVQPGNPRSDAIINSMLAIVIAPGRLVDAGWLAAETAALLDYMRTARSHPGAPVLIPGEPEIAARASRGRDGIPIDDTTLGQLRTAGLSCGMTADRLDALGLAAAA